MLFTETLGPDDLPFLQDEKPDTTPHKPDAATLYQRHENPAAAIRSRFELLVGHIAEIEQTKRKRVVPLSVIRDRIRHALVLGTITMDVTSGNSVSGTSFSPRQITPEKRVFGVYAKEVEVTQDLRDAPGKHAKRTPALPHVQTSPTPPMEHGTEDGMTGLA